MSQRNGGAQPRTLVEKIWERNLVRAGDGGPDLMYVDLHLVHEVTSPQAFEGLVLAGRRVRRPDLTFATVDHNVPTTDRSLPILDQLSKRQLEVLEENAERFGIRLLDINDPRQGIVHVIGPELGLTRPGMIIVCGDSHTSTHGAFGALAFGIGTSEVEHVLATQCIPQRRPRSMELLLEGTPPEGITAKDLILAVIGHIGVSGGGFSVYVGQYKVRVDTSPWWSPGGTKANVVPSIYFVRGRTPTMHPDVPYPENGWHGLFCTFANMFVQAMDVNRLHETLRGLEHIVVVDHQMTETVRWADVVLPATTWYEKTDLTATPLHPFLQLQQPAIEPVGESRSEVWIWRELMRRLDPAKAAEFFEIDEEAAIVAMLEAGGGDGGPTEGITLDQLKAGPVRLNVPDPDVPFRRQVEELVPFPPRSLPAPLEKTAAFVPTGRIEFYKEEARFIELGETVPTYRPPFDDTVHDPAEWPLTLLTPHSKWRIHSSYANNAWLAEIHGGRPEVFIAPPDAAARGIATGDAVRVWNTRGAVAAWAHVSESEQAGVVTLYEGWWPRQFRSGKGVNELTSSAVNPIHEVHFVGNMWSPSTGWKDCRCQVEKASEA